MKPKKSVIEERRLCAVPGCQSQIVDGSPTPPDIHLFPFPSDPAQSSRWCQLLSSTQNLKTPLPCTATSVICNLHFKEEDITVSQTGRKLSVRPHVEPSIFPWTVEEWHRRTMLQPAFMEESDVDSHGDEMENGEYSLPIKKRRRLQESCMQDSVSCESSKSEVPPYCENLLHKMAELQKEGLFCDVHLRSTSSNKSFLAHKVVLASCSPYLKSLLATEARSVTVINMDVSDGSIQDLLDFLYSGVLSLHENTVPELCLIATNWNIKSLLKLCKGEEEAPSVSKLPDHDDNGVLNLTTRTTKYSPMANKLELDLDRQPVYNISPVSASPRDERGLEHREQDPFLGVTVKQEPSDDNVSQGSMYDTDAPNNGHTDYRPLEEGNSLNSLEGNSLESSLQDGLDRRVIGSVHLDEGDLGPVKEEARSIRIADDVDDLEQVMMWKYSDDEHEEQESQARTAPEYDPPRTRDLDLCRCYVCKLVHASVGECVNHMVESHGITREAAMLVLRSSHQRPPVPTEAITKPNAVIQQKTGSRLTLYQCTVCHKHYATLARCRNHIRTVHGQEMDCSSLPERLWEDEPYHCYICQMTFPNAQEGRAHSIVVHCHGQRRKGEDRNGESTSTPPLNGPASPTDKNSSKKDATSSPVLSLQASSSTSKEMPADSSTASSDAKGQNTDFYPFPNHPYQCKLCKTVFEFLDECEGHIMETHNIAAELVYVCYTRRKNRYRRFSNRKKNADVAPAQAAQSTVPSFAAFSASRVSDPPRNLPYKCRVDPDNCLHSFQSPLDQEYHNYLDHGIPLPSWVNDIQCPKCIKNYRNKAALSSHLMKMHRPSEWL